MTIQEFSQRLLEHMGLENFEVTVEEGEEIITLQLQVGEEDSGLLIGYHGESLQAIQKVVQLAFFREFPTKKIVVNVNDYKERRKAQLQEMVDKAAAKVLSSGESYIFPYLAANERLIIHETIAQKTEYAELESISTGDGLQRRLQIQVKVAKTE